ncbi:flagellar basal-body MS-ring/collar protein FliF [Yoonia sp. R2331]|uniref:flagellar basal-body MS-ring/collar protein FliF n=1 Tax=Yoonia sp. R2331 TaxID=3237238 RepID=UPI0034E4594D
MQNLLAVWSTLSAGRRLVVVGATVAVFLAVLFVARAASQKDLTLLYGGLESAAAGDVITALDARGVVYEVRGGAIYVDAAMRDALRMSLAGEGLPAAGAQGYELLDGLSGFGTTSQMFDAAYWRAREGELARTILANPTIRAARVHISTPSSRAFARDQKATAAVTLTTTANALSAQQIKAFQYLVAAAVSGLDPNDVAVIDDRGGLLSDATGAPVGAASDDKAAMLRDQAERLLAARVGPGNAVVEITVDTVTESESITERLIDPDSRVAISTDVTESEAKAQDTRGGDVTVASNLPDGDAGANGGTSSNDNSETRALTNYEISQTERQVVRAPGDIKRLTVAVLVNEVQATSADGTIESTPRTAEELADLEELVASAVGLDTARGDVLTLRSLPFDPLPTLGSEAVGGGVLNQPLNVMQLIQIGVAAVVALILGLFVVRPVLTNAQPVGPNPSLPAPLDVTGPEGAEAELSSAPLIEGTVAPPDAVARLREMIAERETETVQILQDWMEDPQSTEKA